MKKFIESIFDRENRISFNYKDYDTLFVKERYHMFYLFFFLKNEDELLELRNESAELHQTIKSNKDIYEVDMDKNVTCIYCLCVEKEEYYNTEATGRISDLSKKICLVEEDLNFFKKNVLLYTSDMDEFSEVNTGRFDSLCQEIITEQNFQNYKASNTENYQYDFLINIFIKLPSLNFQKYQLREKQDYKSLSRFIDEECNDGKIDKSYIKQQINILESKMDDEDILYAWLDEMVEKRSNNKASDEVRDNEN